MEKKITILSAICIMAGLGLLITQPSEFNDKFTQIDGEVIRITEINGMQLITVKPAEMTVINEKASDLNKGDSVMIKGKIADYEGKIELIAKEIKRLS